MVLAVSIRCIVAYRKDTSIRGEDKLIICICPRRGIIYICRTHGFKLSGNLFRTYGNDRIVSARFTGYYITAGHVFCGA